VLLGIFTLTSCVWVGGYVAIGVVARVANRTLDPRQRVAFFRGLGRSYLPIGGSALAIALGTGAALASTHAWDGVLVATVVTAAALVVSLAIGVTQARRMTRLRAAALALPHTDALAQDVHRGARAATLLRAVIGLLSLALIALGSLLAT
jgi:hypothetical protein